MTPLIVWSDELCVGVAGMDEDHRQLVEIINELCESIVHGADREVVNAILDRLVAVNGQHFASEEKLLQDAGYPEVMDHKLEHDQMSRWAIDCEFHFNQGTLSVTLPELLMQLRERTLSHILDSDKLYGRFLNQKGIY